MTRSEYALKTHVSVQKPTKTKYKNRMQRHLKTLIYKSYLIRMRRWRLLVFETSVAFILFIGAVVVAKPVFLKPLETEPEPPLTKQETLQLLPHEAFVGFAPDRQPFTQIMERAGQLLNTSLLKAPVETDLNKMLYDRIKSSQIKYSGPIIWIIFQDKKDKVWHYSIRSTSQADSSSAEDKLTYQRKSFLAVQCAVSSAILEHVSPTVPQYELTLLTMPVSPLMQYVKVQRTIAIILFTFNVAFIIPVLETTAMVVHETQSQFKRALRLRKVGFSTMYIAWVAYGYMTAIPMCLLGSIILTLLFRWIHIATCLLFVFAYISVMLLTALIMAMFHNKASTACLWTGLMTLLEVFFAALLVFHSYIGGHGPAALLAHIVLPPLGFTHGLNEFALLRTGQQSKEATTLPLVYTNVAWYVTSVVYFCVLMLLQRTIGHGKAVGGQVHWKAIIFKKQSNVEELMPIQPYSGHERDKLQSVDELMAKAISFNNVSKTIMNQPMLENVTFDIYRGEYTIFITETIQDRMMNTLDDLLTGLTYPDKGEINILGEKSEPGNTSSGFFVQSQMMGYYHESSFLIEEWTVIEHIVFFIQISLWTESSDMLSEFIRIRKNFLLDECNLYDVAHVAVSKLGEYYRTQLCWAIAMIMEPRIIIIPPFSDKTSYVPVLRDKIIRYKKYKTIVHLCYSAHKLINADRVFLFDQKLLIFGGTPAYLFFKYGREYRIRLVFKTVQMQDETLNDILENLSDNGASVRAHLGSHLIVQMPLSPSVNVANLINVLMENANRYRLASVRVSLPDAEEIARKVTKESRAAQTKDVTNTRRASSSTLNISSGRIPPEKKRTRFFTRTQLKYFLWKYYLFYIYHTHYLALTIISAIIVGVLIGMSVAQVLTHMHTVKEEAQTVTVEAYGMKTILVLSLDNSTEAMSIGSAYAMSEVGATDKEVEPISYVALSSNESLTEYLVTRAIDSPQYYVFRYAYGMGVKVVNDTLMLQVLYSPMHSDSEAAARALARVYMALIRHYTGTLDTSIVVTSNPLVLDMSSWVAVQAPLPPVFIQLFLVLSTVHITHVPSHEYGLIRHVQTSASNFSILRYWTLLALCDVIMSIILITITSFIIFGILYVVLIKSKFFHLYDLFAIPSMLLLYGVACIPQAYVFSLGNRPVLNAFIYIVICVICSETTISAKMLYGQALHYFVQFLALSPQFNMALALEKITVIFLSNCECSLYKNTNFCSNNTLHRCCPKCGIMQDCYTRKSYLSKSGVTMDVVAIVCTAIFFVMILFLWEYKIFHRIFIYVMSSWIFRGVKTESVKNTPELEGEINKVLDKKKQILRNERITVDTFGEYLLAADLTKSNQGKCKVGNVYFGLGKGEIMSLVGYTGHGRLELCKILAGLDLPSGGHVWAMSKWEANERPELYSRNISICCNLPSLPPWLTIRDALTFIGLLRGLLGNDLKQEVLDLLEVLELSQFAEMDVNQLFRRDFVRVNFAAAIIGAPPIVIMDEFTYYQKYNIRRAIYLIMDSMKKHNHSFLLSSHRVESHLPIASRLATMVEGRIRNIQTVDTLHRSHQGYTVVVHLKNEMDVTPIFASYFEDFAINDTTEVLANVQVRDTKLSWAEIFAKMEKLQAENKQVYSYIICVQLMESVCHDLLDHNYGDNVETQPFPCFKCMKATPKLNPSKEELDELLQFEKKYDLYTLKELPWSVVFQK